MTPGPVDPGLQPERTELAWRRTSLAIALGGLVALRLLPTAFDEPAWIVVGIVAVIVAGVLWIGARRRQRTVTAVLRVSGMRARLPGAVLLGCAALFAAVAGAGGLALIVAVAAA